MLKIRSFFLLIIASVNFCFCQNERAENGGQFSPYNFSFKKELPFIVAGVGTVITSEVLNHTTRLKPFTEAEVAELDRNDVNEFDRPATYNYDLKAAEVSDYLRLGVVVMPALFLVNRNTRQDIFGLAVMTLEVVTINYGVTNGVKFSVNRTRPLVYNEKVPMEVRTGTKSRTSFFSGHSSHTAAVSFMFAKVIIDYYPDLSLSRKITLWGVAGSIPAVTGYLRVKSGNHYPTDVITGCLVGATIGWLVPHLHKVQSNLSVSSYSYREANGVSFTYKF